MKAYFKFVIILQTMLTTVQAEDINRDNKLFDNYALELQSDVFKFSENGKLTNGPRAAAGEPIDYSSLFKEGYLKSAFELSVKGMKKEAPPHKFESRDLKIYTKNKEGFFQNIKKREIERVFEGTISKLGFRYEDTQDLQKANIVINLNEIGSLFDDALKIIIPL